MFFSKHFFSKTNEADFDHFGVTFILKKKLTKYLEGICKIWSDLDFETSHSFLNMNFSHTLFQSMNISHSLFLKYWLRRRKKVYIFFLAIYLLVTFWTWVDWAIGHHINGWRLSYADWGRFFFCQLLKFNQS